MDALLQDIHYGFRQLLRQGGSSLTRAGPDKIPWTVLGVIQSSRRVAARCCSACSVALVSRSRWSAFLA